MERIYRYRALKSLNAAGNDRTNGDANNALETRFLNEAVNFVKDSNDGFITAIKEVPDSNGRLYKQSVILEYAEIRNLSQKEILEEIEKRFSREYK